EVERAASDGTADASEAGRSQGEVPAAGRITRPVRGIDVLELRVLRRVPAPLRVCSERPRGAGVDVPLHVRQRLVRDRRIDQLPLVAEVVLRVLRRGPSL